MVCLSTRMWITLTTVEAHACNSSIRYYNFHSFIRQNATSQQKKKEKKQKLIKHRSSIFSMMSNHFAWFMLGSHVARNRQKNVEARVMRRRKRKTSTFHRIVSVLAAPAESQSKFIAADVTFCRSRLVFLHFSSWMEEEEGRGVMIICTHSCALHSSYSWFTKFDVIAMQLCIEWLKCVYREEFLSMMMTHTHCDELRHGFSFAFRNVWSSSSSRIHFPFRAYFFTVGSGDLWCSPVCFSSEMEAYRPCCGAAVDVFDSLWSPFSFPPSNFFLSDENRLFRPSLLSQWPSQPKSLAGPQCFAFGFDFTEHFARHST